MSTTQPIKRLPAEWEKILNITIMDPDGWDRRNFVESWNTSLTQEEFQEKADMSTLMHLRQP